MLLLERCKLLRKEAAVQGSGKLIAWAGRVIWTVSGCNSQKPRQGEGQGTDGRDLPAGFHERASGCAVKFTEHVHMITFPGPPNVVN